MNVRVTSGVRGRMVRRLGVAVRQALVKVLSCASCGMRGQNCPSNRVNCTRALPGVVCIIFGSEDMSISPTKMAIIRTNPDFDYYDFKPPASRR